MPVNQRRPGRSLAQRIRRWLGGLALALLLLVTVTLTAVFSFEQFTLRPLAERLVACLAKESRDL